MRERDWVYKLYTFPAIYARHAHVAVVARRTRTRPWNWNRK